ncbi:HNH endonuclease [Cobetia sp. 1CM21F]|nr:HNH endonuclease [Cobetia sp. 1CM21F]
MNRITPATEVDHIVGKAQGGTDAPGNLEAICKACHQAKTASEAQAARSGDHDRP